MRIDRMRRHMLNLGPGPERRFRRTMPIELLDTPAGIEPWVNAYRRALPPQPPNTVLNAHLEDGHDGTVTLTLALGRTRETP